MNILGFSCWEGGVDGHDSSAAVVCDGGLVAAAEEERFTRQKHDGAFPIHAINYCLREAGLGIQDIDFIAFPDKPFRFGRDSKIAEMDRQFVRQLRTDRRAGRSTLIHKRLASAYVKSGLPFNLMMAPEFAAGFKALRRHFGSIPPARFFDHHRSHAAASYLTSGRDAATVLTIDNIGGPYSCVAWKAEGVSISRLRAEPFYNSLGAFFYDCTRYLGLGTYGEGKAMGLAAYGDPSAFVPQLSAMLDTTDALWFHYRRPPHPELMGFPPRNGEVIREPRFQDFAASFQRALESAVHRAARWTIERAGSRDLCLGGGVALNCSANGTLLREGIADYLSVFPAAGDAGLAVGAALLCAADVGELQSSELAHAYWGPGFSDTECRKVIESDRRLSFHLAENLTEEVSAVIAGGEVVGWFQGRMEFGPRALGNRSILADPRTIEMRDRVNRIKRRELWRALAPVVLAEHASRYFTLSQSSPFMLIATAVRPEVREIVPAIVHVDHTARPQTVTREQNPRLYELLSAFHRKTGVPILLNTSFNSEVEPIVCTPSNAVETFLSTGLDVLVLGDFIVRRAASSRAD